MASVPPRRTLPSGEIARPRQTSTKMLPALMKNQSRFEVSQPRIAVNIGSTWFWKASVSTTKATTSRPEIANTRLWMSRPKGPTFTMMLSWPTL